MSAFCPLFQFLLAWLLLLVEKGCCQDERFLETHHPYKMVKPSDVKKNFVSATLGSNMVLQRDQPAVLWGYDSQPGVTVTASVKELFREKFSAETKVASDGIWRLQLPPQPKSKVPIKIVIESTSGQKETLENVLFGDVYICGGQSNMGFSLPVNTNAKKELKRGDEYPHIRIMTVGNQTGSDAPLPDLHTLLQPWSVANEESLSSKLMHTHQSYFSSVCWFFGREIADGLNNEVPIGLISSNLGGTKLKHWEKKGCLFNAMIHPFMVGPMAITGFAWYQGESDAHIEKETKRYKSHFPELIKTWRKGFAVPDAYFGFVQLSSGCDRPALPLLRRAQMKVLERVEGKIAYATNADRGDLCNIHPPAKQDIGKRLGRSALAVQYGQGNHWKSPSYSHSAPGEQITGDDGKVSIVITLHDVSPQGLKLIDTPYNIDPNRPSSNMPSHPVVGGEKRKEEKTCDDFEKSMDMCVGAQILFDNDDRGWIDATIAITGPNKVTLTAAEPGGGGGVIKATRYGWGQVPLLTIYDQGTDLPVLPWKAEAKERLLPSSGKTIKQEKNTLQAQTHHHRQRTLSSSLRRAAPATTQ